MHTIARLTEGIISAEVDGVTSIPAAVDHLRAVLGRSVLGPVPTTMPYDLVEIDEAAAVATIADRSPERLVAERRDPPDGFLWAGGG